MLEVSFDLKVKVYVENSEPASSYDITSEKEYFKQELNKK